MGTTGTVQSGSYLIEIEKFFPGINVFQEACPMWVPLVENNAFAYAEPILGDYIAPLLTEGVDTLVLGCTHYPLFKAHLRKRLAGKIAVVSQDEFIPTKLADYLRRHPEINQKLSKNGTHHFLVTDLAPSTREVARIIFGAPITLEKVTLD